MNELYVNERGEAIQRVITEEDKKCVTDPNPFMQLSNDLVEDWSPNITQNAAKTWKSTLKSTENLNTTNMDQKQKEELFLQDFLNAILPPIPTQITNDNEKKQVAYSLVSTKQARRSEIRQMDQCFDELIKERRARKVGLDDIRYDLSFKLFDELIRQIAIDCKERGLMCLRIRDEAKVTLAAYGILKQVASVFSINQAEKSDQGFDTLIQSKNQLLEKKKQLQNKLLKLQNDMQDKHKEVQVLANVQAEQLKKHKIAMENEGNQLQAMIDTKRRDRKST
eukprot:18344_1